MPFTKSGSSRSGWRVCMESLLQNGIWMHLRSNATQWLKWPQSARLFWEHNTVRCRHTSQEESGEIFSVIRSALYVKLDVFLSEIQEFREFLDWIPTVRFETKKHKNGTAIKLEELVVSRLWNSQYESQAVIIPDDHLQNLTKSHRLDRISYGLQSMDSKEVSYGGHPPYHMADHPFHNETFIRPETVISYFS